VRKLESRYPGGSFDANYSENRKEGDIWVCQVHLSYILER
jgi:hypothetical protein